MMVRVYPLDGLCTKALVILCKIHIYRSRNNTVVEGILPVTPVVRCSTTDVGDHAPEDMNLPPF